MYLEMDVIEPLRENSGSNIGVSLVKRFGLAMIDYVEFQIGGQTIDKHYGEWMDIWSQLSMNKEEYTKFKRLIDGSLVNNNMYKFVLLLSICLPEGISPL